MKPKRDKTLNSLKLLSKTLQFRSLVPWPMLWGMTPLIGIKY